MAFVFSLLFAALVQVPGGWSKQAVDDKAVVAAAEFALKAEAEALKKDGKIEKVVLVQVLAAETQVVQGLNYRLTLQVRLGEGDVKKIEAVVWERLWLKPEEQRLLTSWKAANP